MSNPIEDLFFETPTPDCDWELVEDDIMEFLPTLPEDSIDGCLCDPPYGVEFLGKDWDKEVPGESACWREVRRVMKPGSYLLAYGGTEKWHRLAVAIEDAGFEIVDTISWVYGNGMTTAYKVTQSLEGEKADRYQGYFTKLKSAWDPIILAVNPKEGTYSENIDEHDVAGMNMDDNRIPCEENPSLKRREAAAKSGKVPDSKKEKLDCRTSLDQYIAPREAEGDGRFPPNVITSPEVRDDMYPEAHDEKGDHYFLCQKPASKEREIGLEDGDKEHPTVKPVDLNEWLASLIKPPEREDDTRTLLNPFAGSGSEIAGGVRAGWEEVVGIERNPEYVESAEKRIPELIRLSTS